MLFEKQQLITVSAGIHVRVLVGLLHRVALGYAAGLWTLHIVMLLGVDGQVSADRRLVGDAAAHGRVGVAQPD